MGTSCRMLLVYYNLSQGFPPRRFQSEIFACYIPDAKGVALYCSPVIVHLRQSEPITSGRLEKPNSSITALQVERSGFIKKTGTTCRFNFFDPGSTR